MKNKLSSITEGLAVELYLDVQAEIKVRTFRDVIYSEGVKPVQGSMNDKPHVSLAVFPKMDADKLVDLTAEFASTIARFDFRIDAVGTFPNQENILFLYPVPSASLLQAHAEFHRLLKITDIENSRYYAPGNWVPHLTLEFGITNREFTKAIKVFKEKFVPITGEFTQIGVVGFRPIVYINHFELKRGH